MADVAVSAETSFELCSQAAVDLLVGSETLDVDLSTDYLAFDFLEQVTLKRVGSSSVNDAGIVQQADVCSRVIPHALKRAVSDREVVGDDTGRLRIGDVRWEIPADELPGIVPQVGDKILAAETWNVFAVDRCTDQTRWRCYARLES